MPKPIVIAIIPARLGSTRFPRKVLARETGRPLIQHVVEAARRARVLSRVVVATDAPEVAAAVAAFGGESVMTRADHPNGTSRLAQAVRALKLADHDIVVNVQGDEPEMESAFIKAAVAALTKTKTEVATVALPFAPGEDASNPNIVKVVTSRGGLAMYFSRSLIPFVRDSQSTPTSPPLRHVGLYAYRVAFLKKYAKLTPAPPEIAESLEQLRVLWHGHQIAVAVCKGNAPSGIDTPEQYESFVARYRASAI